MLHITIVLIIYVLDQLSKFCVEKLVVHNSGIPIINNIFHITLVHNTGAAFGVFKGLSHLFVAIAFLSVTLIVWFLITRFKVLCVTERLALCFVLGGILGNLTDRLRFGYVIDFIDLRVWPVFNLADSFITIGAIMLAWTMIRAQRETG